MIKEKHRVLSLFELISVLISIAVILFIASAILAVILKGMPSLKDAIFSREVRFSIGLSLYTASISTFICIVCSIPTAYIITRRSFPMKRLIEIIIELPLSMPYLVLGLGLLVVFSSDFGKMLREFGFPVIFHKNGIILAQTIINLPYAIRFVKLAFQEIDQRLEYIAGILGATKWHRFRTITLPLSKYAIINAVILVWSRGLGEFGATLMLVGITRMKTETLPASVYLNMATGDLNGAMASATVILTISFISLFITNWLGRKNEQLTRMKDVNI